jgi:DNA-directed RNA polymerase subunit RPC12/RpoP
MKSVGLSPIEPYKSSGVPWKSRCITCNKIVSPNLASVKLRGSGCAYCAGRRIDSTDAIAIFTSIGLKPLEPNQGNKHPWRSIHIPCGREVSPHLNGIKQGQGPCKYCAGVAVLPKDAERLFLSKDLKPVEPYSGDSKKPWRSIHIPCGNEVSPNYNIIQRDESIGCKFCSDQFVDPDEAFQFFMSRDLQPLVPYPGTSKPWKSVHTVCGEVIQPRYGHIKAGRTGEPCSSKLSFGP